MPSEDYRQFLSRYRQARENLTRRREEYQQLACKKATKAQQLTTIHSTVEFVQRFSKTVQEMLHREFSSLVTYALHDIFGNDFDVELRFGSHGTRTTARVVLVDRDGKEYDPMTSNGGGFVDVIAFCFRAVVVYLNHQMMGTEPVMIMDEPFRMVSKQYREGLANLLKMISQKLGIQFIYVTHDPSLMVSEVVRVVQTNRRSKVVS